MRDTAFRENSEGQHGRKRMDWMKEGPRLAKENDELRYRVAELETERDNLIGVANMWRRQACVESACPFIDAKTIGLRAEIKALKTRIRDMMPRPATARKPEE